MTTAIQHPGYIDVDDIVTPDTPDEDNPMLRPFAPTGSIVLHVEDGPRVRLAGQWLPLPDLELREGMIAGVRRAAQMGARSSIPAWRWTGERWVPMPGGAAYAALGQPLPKDLGKKKLTQARAERGAITGRLLSLALHLLEQGATEHSKRGEHARDILTALDRETVRHHSDTEPRPRPEMY